MSVHLHCDGPGCVANKPYPEISSEPPLGWLRLAYKRSTGRAYDRIDVQHFCSAECRYNWSYITTHSDAGK